MPGSALARLEAICEAGKDKMYPMNPYRSGGHCEALARDVSQAERMMALLNQEFDRKQ